MPSHVGLVEDLVYDSFVMLNGFPLTYEENYHQRAAYKLYVTVNCSLQIIHQCYHTIKVRAPICLHSRSTNA